MRVFAPRTAPGQPGTGRANGGGRVDVDIDACPALGRALIFAPFAPLAP